MKGPVLVTGGTRGLGLATTRLLAKQGYHVIATGRSCTEEIEALTSDDSLAGRVFYARLELRDHASLQPFLGKMSETFGEIYGLVNNAAIGHDGVLATMHESEIEASIDVNLLGTILLTKYACRSMLINRVGRVVNVASIVGHTGFSGLSVYSATKGAILAFTRSLARELGKANITVNSVSPGFLDTEMTASIGDTQLESIRRRSPAGKLASVDDVAHAIAFLLSDSAQSITGTDLVVDAGSGYSLSSGSATGKKRALRQKACGSQDDTTDQRRFKSRYR